MVEPKKKEEEKKKKRGTKLGQAKKYDPYSLVHCKSIEDIQHLRRRYTFHAQSKICVCGCPKMWHATRGGNKVTRRGSCCYCDGKTNPNYSICNEYKYVFDIVNKHAATTTTTEEEVYLSSAEAKEWGWVPGLGPDDIGTTTDGVVGIIEKEEE